MTALDFIKSIPHLPSSRRNPGQRPSNGELMTWLNDGAIVFEYQDKKIKPKPYDEIRKPYCLVFFPNGHRVTM